MSMFFKALEQAERDGNGRYRGRMTPPPPPPPAERPAASATVTEPSVDEAPPRQFESAAGPATGPVYAPAAAPAIEAPVAPAQAVHAAEPVEALPTATVSAGTIDEHLVSLLEPSSFAAEQYRALRHTVEQLHRVSGHSIFAVGSPSAGEGKTTTALNLAGALAQSPDARVLLVEADLRCPTVAERLGLDTGGMPGLVEAIQSPHLRLADVARTLDTYNLSVVVAGQTPATPYEVLQAPRLGELLDEARRHYHYVVIDTPPIVAFPDCRVLGRWVDGWLVVVAAHRTSRKLLEEALDLMEEKKTIGFVFTHDERFRAGTRYYGGYYGASGRRANGRSR
jgi:capsular exopolysaccharide synthesis family protein